MAAPTNVFDSYEAIGNKEDLSDVIWDTSPSETPFLSAIPKTKAKGTLHEWQTDAIAAAAANAQIEGNDATALDLGSTTRLTNQSQILTKNIAVTGTQEAVDSAGTSA